MDSQDLTTFRRNVKNGEWIVKWLAEKDKPTYTSECYKVFFNVYEAKNDRVINTWFVCSCCGIVMHLNLQTESYKLRRHGCYKNFQQSQKKDIKGEGTSEEKENETDNKADEEEYISDGETFKQDEKGRIFFQNVNQIVVDDTIQHENMKDSDDDDIVVSHKRKKPIVIADYDEEGDEHKTTADDGQVSLDVIPAKSTVARSNIFADKTQIEEPKLCDKYRRLLAYSFAKFGRVCSLTAAIPSDRLESIIPHDFDIESWKTFDLETHRVAAQLAEESALSDSESHRNSHSRSGSRSGSRSRNRSRSRSDPRSRNRSRSRSGSRSRNRSRSGSRSDTRSRSHTRQKSQSKSRTNSYSNSRLKSLEARIQSMSFVVTDQPESQTSGTKPSDPGQESPEPPKKKRKVNFVNGIPPGPLQSKPAQVRNRFAAKPKAQTSDRVLRKRN